MIMTVCIIFCRLMFWSEDNSIQRASMDGSNRRTLHSTIISSIKLALDIQTQTLYWNSGYRQLESSNLDGSNNRLILAASVVIRHLAVLEANVLYYIEGYQLKRINITDGPSTTTLMRWSIHCPASDLQIVDQLKQPVGMLCICTYTCIHRHQRLSMLWGIAHNLNGVDFITWGPFAASCQN